MGRWACSHPADSYQHPPPLPVASRPCPAWVEMMTPNSFKTASCSRSAYPKRSPVWLHSHGEQRGILHAATTARWPQFYRDPLNQPAGPGVWTMPGGS